MSIINKTALAALAATKFPDNNVKQITPADLREVTNAQIDSAYNRIDDRFRVGLQNYYAVNRDYVVGECCIESGQLYSCTTNTSGAFNPAHWTAVNAVSAAKISARVNLKADDFINDGVFITIPTGAPADYLTVTGLSAQLLDKRGAVATIGGDLAVSVVKNLTTEITVSITDENAVGGGGSVDLGGGDLGWIKIDRNPNYRSDLDGLFVSCLVKQ